MHLFRMSFLLYPAGHQSNGTAAMGVSLTTGGVVGVGAGTIGMQRKEPSELTQLCLSGHDDSISHSFMSDEINGLRISKPSLF